MAHNDDATRKVGQIFLENLKCLYVKIVRRFVEHEKVRIPHQYRAEIELPFFSSRQLVDIVVLLFGCEKEILKELAGGEMLAVTHVNVFGDVSYDVNYLLFFVKFKAFLREVAEPDGVSNIYFSFIDFHQSEQHFDESRLSRSIIAHDAHLLVSGKIVVEIFQYDVILAVFL